MRTNCYLQKQSGQKKPREEVKPHRDCNKEREREKYDEMVERKG